MLKKDLSKRNLYIIIAVLVVVKLLLVSQQMLYLLPRSAPLDDDLYLDMALNITQGNWLGEYDSLTLSKHPFFAVYLAFLNFFSIPFLIANQMLWILLALLAIFAFSKIIKNNYLKLLLFFVIVYSPANTAEFTLRAYRDSFYPVVCMVFFIALIGMALRYKDDIKSFSFYSVLSGVSLGLSLISREDGYWILPFGIVACLITMFFIFKNGKDKMLLKFTAIISQFVIATGIVLIICFINYQHYGVFILSDYSSGSFTSAYGAMTSLSHDDWHPLIAVPTDVRNTLYEESKTFSILEDTLESDSFAIGFKNKELNDFQSGSFYWALRTAAQINGVYSSPENADEFWQELEGEIIKVHAEDEEAIALRSSLTPPIKIEYVPMVMQEMMENVSYVLKLEGMQPYKEYLSDTSTGQIELWQDFLHTKSNYSAIENTSVPYYTNTQHIAFKTLEIIKLFFYPLLYIGLISFAFKMISNIKNYKNLKDEEIITSLALIGMLLMAIFRIAIISFMEVAAFNIGVYAMYISIAYPILFIISIFGIEELTNKFIFKKKYNI